MNATNRHSRSEGDRAVGEAIADRFLRQYRKSGGVRPPILYCGVLGSRADLEVHLWKLVECLLSEEQERDLLDHAQDCSYCQSRMRDMARVLCDANPETAPVVKPVPVMLRFKRIITTVKGTGAEFWAEVLVAVENTGEWLAGSLGAGLVLRPLPAARGLGRGTTKDVPLQSRLDESPIKSVVSALKASFCVEEKIISCGIRSEGTDLILRIEPSGGIDTELESLPDAVYRIDDGPEKPISLVRDGTEIAISQHARQIEVSVCREGAVVGQLIMMLD